MDFEIFHSNYHQTMYRRIKNIGYAIDDRGELIKKSVITPEDYERICKTVNNLLPGVTPEEIVAINAKALQRIDELDKEIEEIKFRERTMDESQKSISAFKGTVQKINQIVNRLPSDTTDKIETTNIKNQSLKERTMDESQKSISAFKETVQKIKDFKWV